MYVTPNDRALFLYGGMIGAFLESAEASSFDRSNHRWDLIETAVKWLRDNNPFIREICPALAYNGMAERSPSLPRVQVVNADTEPAVPHRRPDIVMNPLDFDREVRNEDCRYHRLPAGTVKSVLSEALQRVVNHGDKHLELLVFPYLYPHGKGQWQYSGPCNQRQELFPDVYSDSRDRRRVHRDGEESSNSMSESPAISLLEDTRIKLNSAIPYFRNDWYWAAFMYLEIEKRRIHQNSARLHRLGNANRASNRPTGAELLRRSLFGNWNIIDEKIGSTLPAFIRTGDTFFANAESNINAMNKAFGKPKLFVTLTFSERWEQFQRIIQRAQDVLSALSGVSSSDGPPLPSDFPWEAIQYYYERIYHFRRFFLCNRNASGFGKLQESVTRHEFQLRQAIHTHMLLWVEVTIEEMIERKFVRADLPDPQQEPELYQAVMAHQIHTCREHICGKPPGHADVNHPCRKGFPQPLSPVTHCRKGDKRYLYARFKAADQNVVPYSPAVLLVWGGHVNVQYVTDTGLSKYVAKYVTKAEPKSIVATSNLEDRIKTHIEGRRLGAMEVICLLDSKPILKLSSSVLYLPNSLPEVRTYAIRPVHEVERDPDNPFYPDSVERYFKRPVDPVFAGLTYPEYYAHFVIEKAPRQSKRQHRSNGASQSDSTVECWRDQMKNYVYRRSKMQVTRSPFRRLADGESFFYASLLEKCAWRREEDILGDCRTY
jgi:Helitron helicase-like domain at N-terminus